MANVFIAVGTFIFWVALAYLHLRLARYVKRERLALPAKIHPMPTGLEHVMISTPNANIFQSILSVEEWGFTLASLAATLEAVLIVLSVAYPSL